MDSFKAVTAAAGLTAAVISFSESIYPSEKFAVQLKYIFSVMILLTIAAPFVSGEADIEAVSYSIKQQVEQTYSCEEGVFDYFKDSVESNISTAITEQLEKNMINVSEIKTSINISDSGSISINEIEIAVENAAREGEIIALIKEYVQDDTIIKIMEISDNGH